MPLLRINAGPNGPVPHTGDADVDDLLAQQSDGNGPAIVMVHGYKFSPSDPASCPHRHILALTPDIKCWKAVSWPQGLGFGQGDRDEGLGIAFGWNAKGTIWHAYAEAKRAGRALAQVIRRLYLSAPQRPIHAIAHSMGARVVLSALPYLPVGALRRIVILGGAEFCATAQQALRSPAGRAAELVNVTSRENDFYDFLLERLITPQVTGDCAMGGRKLDLPNVATVQLDATPVLNALRLRGFPIAPPPTRMCHWTFYIRDGVFDFYSALLREPDRQSLPLLRAALDHTPTPRWSRLFARPQIITGLSPFGKAPS